jgi:ketosteroid isomerase-like protein
MNPADVTERYFASVQARDLDGLSALYAENACFTLPNGREFNGIDAPERFCGGRPNPHPAGEHCWR